MVKHLFPPSIVCQSLNENPLNLPYLLSTFIVHIRTSEPQNLRTTPPPLNSKLSTLIVPLPVVCCLLSVDLSPLNVHPSSFTTEPQNFRTLNRSTLNVHRSPFPVHPLSGDANNTTQNSKVVRHSNTPLLYHL